MVGCTPAGSPFPRYRAWTGCLGFCDIGSCSDSWEPERARCFGAAMRQAFSAGRRKEPRILSRPSTDYFAHMLLRASSDPGSGRATTGPCRGGRGVKSDSSFREISPPASGFSRPRIEAIWRRSGQHVRSELKRKRTKSVRRNRANKKLSYSARKYGIAPLLWAALSCWSEHSQQEALAGSRADS